VCIIARGIRNLLTNFDVSESLRSRLMGEHLSDASEIATLTFDLADHGDMDLRPSPSLKFVGKNASRSEDMMHFQSQHVGLDL